MRQETGRSRGSLEDVLRVEENNNFIIIFSDRAFDLSLTSKAGLVVRPYRSAFLIPSSRISCAGAPLMGGCLFLSRVVILTSFIDSLVLGSSFVLDKNQLFVIIVGVFPR